MNVVIHLQFSHIFFSLSSFNKLTEQMIQQAEALQKQTLQFQ